MYLLNLKFISMFLENYFSRVQIDQVVLYLDLNLWLKNILV